MTSRVSVADRLVHHVHGWAAEHGPGLVVGVSGPQGCGKTTACAEAAGRLRAQGLRTAVLALDDLYLPRADREALARETHPLLVTRGPPGTHDVPLGLDLLDRLRRRASVRLPRFDKGLDERAPEPVLFQGPADVVLFEGWCVGARPQGAAGLSVPANALEREEDASGAWRAAVDAQLAGPYRALWAAMDRLVLLVGPDWDTVCGWRAQAERASIVRNGRGMGPAALARFMSHYERLTVWTAADLPARADVVLRLGPDRAPVEP